MPHYRALDGQLVISPEKPRLGAMQEAMQELCKKKLHPYFWAPFIVIGQDGSLTQ